MIDVLHGNYYIVCPTQQEADALFETFDALGLRWNGGEPLSTTHWLSNEKLTYYRLRDGKIRYGNMKTDYEKSLVRNNLLGSACDITFTVSDFINLSSGLEQEQEINNLESII